MYLAQIPSFTCAINKPRNSDITFQHLRSRWGKGARADLDGVNGVDWCRGGGDKRCIFSSRTLVHLCQKQAHITYQKRPVPLGQGSCHSVSPGNGGIKIEPDFTSTTIIVNICSYYGGNGATSFFISSSNAGGACGANGGGGAGGNAPANTDQGNTGAGADGIQIDIDGNNCYWGGGGGGGQYQGTKTACGGKGGGGGGSASQQPEQVETGGIGGITDGENGDPEGDGTPTAGSGGPGTGSCGGVGRTNTSPNAVSGSGGSGIVIIRY